MPLIVRYTIGPKRHGNWRCPLSFHLSFEEGEDLALGPYLHFEREYRLPGPILLTAGEVPQANGGYCKSVDVLSYRINGYFYTPTTWHIRPSLSCGLKNVCHLECNYCRAFLPHRSTPDYSDYEEVFRQVAGDLMAAWNEAVEKARQCAAIEKREVVFSSDDFIGFDHARQAELEQVKPMRRVKV